MKRVKLFAHDAPESLPGTEGKSREVVMELQGSGYFLVTDANGKTTLYRTKPGTMDQREREADYEEEGGVGAESWVGGRRNSTGYRINAGDQSEAEGWALVIQRLDRIEQALLILIGDNDDDNPDDDPGSILQQTANDHAPRRRRPTTHDAFPRRDSEIRSINQRNRAKYNVN